MDFYCCPHWGDSSSQFVRVTIISVTEIEGKSYILEVVSRKGKEGTTSNGDTCVKEDLPIFF